MYVKKRMSDFRKSDIRFFAYIKLLRFSSNMFLRKNATTKVLCGSSWFGILVIKGHHLVKQALLYDAPQSTNASYNWYHTEGF